MEYTGKEPDLILGTIHGPGYAGAGGKSTWFRQEFDVFEDWHTYAIDWDETGIRWYFDEELYAEVGPDNLGRANGCSTDPSSSFSISPSAAHSVGSSTPNSSFPCSCTSTTCASTRPPTPDP